jgi:hypothetical protein
MLLFEEVATLTDLVIETGWQRGVRFDVGLSKNTIELVEGITCDAWGKWVKRFRVFGV